VAFTFVTITHSFQTAAELAAAGEVDFVPVEPIHNGTTIAAKSVTATLSGAGQLSQLLAANTDPGTLPSGTTYKVTERIVGQPTFSYYIQIPHDQGPTLDLRTLAGWVGNTSAGSGVLTVNAEAPDGTGNLALSSSDIGAQPIADMLTRLSLAPNTITYAASITPDASVSCVHWVTATGDLTIADITNGITGQLVMVRVKASGATRTVTPISGVSIVVPTGERWVGRFLYDGPDATWLLL
jgi:hypothetical protein